MAVNGVYIKRCKYDNNGIITMTFAIYPIEIEKHGFSKFVYSLGFMISIDQTSHQIETFGLECASEKPPFGAPTLHPTTKHERAKLRSKLLRQGVYWH